MQYQLKLQQLVTYSRCRIYRDFIQKLTECANIRRNGKSYLFCFIMLCSLANFRRCCVTIDGDLYTLLPGEQIVTVNELMILFRKKTAKETISVLSELSKKQLITYATLNHSRYIKISINNWSKYNATYNMNVISKTVCNRGIGREEGFFFFPYRLAEECIAGCKCSEMDILLDLWLHTVYNDPCIAGSSVGPVVYFRNKTQSPLVGYEELGQRWGVSKSTAGRILRKLEGSGYVKLIAFPGKYGTAIYLCNYLSTMFQISDVGIDKEDVAMALNIKICITEENEMIEAEGADIGNDGDLECQNSEILVSSKQVFVSNHFACVPKSHLTKIVQKAGKVLYMRGIMACLCSRVRYVLFPLSQDCTKDNITACLIIRCPGGVVDYRFILTIRPIRDNREGK